MKGVQAQMTDESRKIKSNPISVRLLTASSEAALVEWEFKGKLSRATIQAADYVDGCVDAAALATAIPWGIPWEEIKFAQPKPEQVADALRRAGIWTKQDLFTNPSAAIGALQSVYQLHLGTLVEFVSAAQEKEIK